MFWFLVLSILDMRVILMVEVWLLCILVCVCIVVLFFDIFGVVIKVLY